MIYNSTIEAVYPLAEKLVKSGIKVSALQTTPVHQLVCAGHVDKPSGNTAIEEDVVQVILDGAESKDPDGACRHDIVITELTEVISKSVRNNLDIARNVVNPIVKDAVVDMEEFIQNSLNVKPNYVSVVPKFWHNFWNGSAVRDMVSRYSEMGYKEVKLTNGFVTSSDNVELIELCKTGAKRFDESLVEYIATWEIDKLVGIYNSIFSNLPVVRAESLNDAINGESADEALVAYLIATNMFNNPPENSGMGLEHYRSYMSDIMAQSGRMLLQILDRRERDFKNNVLIKSWPYSDGDLGAKLVEIYVNGDVYNKFLKEGGTPEAIIGSFVSSKERGYTPLLEQATEFAKHWERHERVLTTTQRLNRHNFAIEGITLAVTNQINSLDDDSLIVPREILHRKLKEQISKLRGNFHERPYESVRMVVCNTMFPHTDALSILTAMDNVAKDYPEMDIREVALLATIEIVSTWMVKLLKVEHSS